MSIDVWTIAGTLFGFASLVLALVQTVRYRAARRLLIRLNEREQVATWALYDLVVQAYDKIGEARSALKSENEQPRESVERTAQVATLLNAMWLMVVQHAATLEHPFDHKTLERWRALGRLDSDWRMARAKKLLPDPVKSTLRAGDRS